eukprot:8491871-Alexandrium_andersonii.AAC.1
MVELVCERVPQVFNSLQDLLDGSTAMPPAWEPLVDILETMDGMLKSAWIGTAVLFTIEHATD